MPDAPVTHVPIDFTDLKARFENGIAKLEALDPVAIIEQVKTELSGFITRLESLEAAVKVLQEAKSSN